MKTMLTPGCHKISFADYLADPCPEPSLSRSTIKDLLRCPAKAWWNHPRLNPAYTAAQDEKFDIGTAAHAMFLEGTDAAEIIDAPDWRTKAAQMARTEAYQNGKVPLLKHQYAMVGEMNDAAVDFLSFAFSQDFCLDGGDAELTYIWKSGDTWLRARPDWISRDKALILDYKTTGQSANPEDYVRIILSNGLDIQEALYRRGVKEIEGTDPEFIFLVQETEPPYLCSAIKLNAMFQDMGRQKVKKGITLWEQCLATGEWLGYPSSIYTLEAPAWAMAAWEMRRFGLELDYQPQEAL